MSARREEEIWLKMVRKGSLSVDMVVVSA
jgi:hypothetical protein